jgi:hypothetical protein
VLAAARLDEFGAIEREHVVVEAKCAVGCANVLLNQEQVIERLITTRASERGRNNRRGVCNRSVDRTMPMLVSPCHMTHGRCMRREGAAADETLVRDREQTWFRANAVRAIHVHKKLAGRKESSTTRTIVDENIAITRKSSTNISLVQGRLGRDGCKQGHSGSETTGTKDRRIKGAPLIDDFGVKEESTNVTAPLLPDGCERIINASPSRKIPEHTPSPWIAIRCNTADG